MSKIKKLNKQGFTLFETMVSISFFVMIILATLTIFLMAQNIYRIGSAQSELSQNARICLDRVSREIRQSTSIITDFSLTATSSSIFFQDGHNTEQISYITYYASSTDLMRKHSAYAFSANPDVYVTHDSIDIYSYSPTEIILEDRLIGEYFANIQFSNSSGLLEILLNLATSGVDLDFTTSVYIRNW